ncbi:ABC transporter ATPase [Methanocaldococcus villosus KIN24-T80]|uniref:ABC transporter ATPase n=1 Tax=Methanocaldococcus villosus KIN24-T80 TaxID=1069083 RepID=N6VPU1_9EURY|nr:P-loop domain-containing protein [Methanocaldococcus villosus]ENN95920.1 ABC transporter ATPase [Methanocaldococcus villosus KIN24-T80]
MIDSILSHITCPFLDNRLITKANKNKIYYAVKQPDGNIKVVLPFVFENEKFLKLSDYKDGIEGATQRVIEEIKSEIINKKRFLPLAGYFGKRYRSLYEPLTVVNCTLNIGSDLWRADDYNYIDGNKIYLLLRMVFKERDEKVIAEKIDEIGYGLERLIKNINLNILIDEAKNIIDQKFLREKLKELNLVSFIANDSKPARKYTEVRKHYRIAGPKEINIPFVCPKELKPIEIELKYRVVEGLGIKRKEVFVITGRNAQGKTTMLQAIESGQDDHIIGDGREFIITVRNLIKATTGSMEMNGEDISLFFQKLPKGIRGSPKAVYGTASGSMYMAYQIQKAIKNKRDIILIDEDNSAVNLLVSGVLSRKFEGVKSLAEIIAYEREKLGESTFIITTSSLDLLTAVADRAMYLEDHKAYYLDLKEFKEELKKYYLEIIDSFLNK